MRSPRIVLCALLAWAGAAFAAVDANTASADALQSVRGVGPTIAQRIVEERRRGPYASLDDLQARVRGVGEASVRRMAAAGLSVGGPARLQGTGGVGRVHDVAPPASTSPGPAASRALLRSPDAESGRGSAPRRADGPRRATVPGPDAAGTRGGAAARPATQAQGPGAPVR
jgi:competence protein ComEA